MTIFEIYMQKIKIFEVIPLNIKWLYFINNSISNLYIINYYIVIMIIFVDSILKIGNGLIDRLNNFKQKIITLLISK